MLLYDLSMLMVAALGLVAVIALGLLIWLLQPCMLAPNASELTRIE